MQSADRHQLLQDVICLRLTAPLGRVAGEGDESGELGGIFLEAAEQSREANAKLRIPKVLFCRTLVSHFRRGWFCLGRHVGPPARKATTIFPGDKTVSYVAAWEVRTEAADLGHKPW